MPPSLRRCHLSIAWRPTPRDSGSLSRAPRRHYTIRRILRRQQCYPENNFARHCLLQPCEADSVYMYLRMQGRLWCKLMSPHLPGGLPPAAASPRCPSICHTCCAPPQWKLLPTPLGDRCPRDWPAAPPCGHHSSRHLHRVSSSWPMEPQVGAIVLRQATWTTQPYMPCRAACIGKEQTAPASELASSRPGLPLAIPLPRRGGRPARGLPGGGPRRAKPSRRQH